MTKQSENLIHVKFEYPEAVQSKREILSSQVALLKILQIVKHYHQTRIEELKLKTKLSKQIKDLKSSISKLHQTLPKIKLPEILQTDEEREEKKTKLKTKKVSEYKDKNLELQLKEIQDSLKKLS